MPKVNSVINLRWYRRFTVRVIAIIIFLETSKATDLKYSSSIPHKKPISKKNPDCQKRLLVKQMNQPDRILPTTVAQAVERLIADLPLREQVKIAGRDESHLMDLYFTLSVDIEDKFRIFENQSLLESCRMLSEDQDFFAEEAALIIIMELWKRLQKIHPPAGFPN
jgi:hypothetical protein